MINTIGWIVTINVVIICFTCYKCKAMLYRHMDDCLTVEKDRVYLNQEEDLV